MRHSVARWSRLIVEAERCDRHHRPANGGQCGSVGVQHLPVRSRVIRVAPTRPCHATEVDGEPFDATGNGIEVSLSEAV